MKYFPQQILNSSFPEVKTSRKEAGRAGAGSLTWVHCILWFRNNSSSCRHGEHWSGGLSQCFFCLSHFQSDRDKLTSLSKWLKTNDWLEYLSQEKICTKVKIFQLVFKGTSEWCGLRAPILCWATAHSLSSTGAPCVFLIRSYPQHHWSSWNIKTLSEWLFSLT